MAEANKDEVRKCKQIAQSALASGDAEKAIRFLQKAKRMCPEDGSLDALIQEASSSTPASSTTKAPSSEGAAPEGPRLRPSTASSTASGAGAARTSKDGRSYTSEQMQLVQSILRSNDYYDILQVARDANEDAVKKAYKKLALKLHPDKNKAPGAEEAFKKLSKAAQCLTDDEKKQVYDRYGDEDRIPRQHQQAYQQDFMSPEDLFSAFFGGGGATFHTFHTGGQRRGSDNESGPQQQRAQLLQMLPLLLLVILTLLSNFGSRDGGSRFSFKQTDQYHIERHSETLKVQYFVAENFESRYPYGSQELADFEHQVEIYYVRDLSSQCDYQDRVRYNKMMIAKRRGSQEEMQQARNHAMPACSQLDKVKKRHSSIYRSAMYIGAH